MNKNARKIKFHQGFAEYQSIYVYIVYAYTDDYNANCVRLLVTSSYEKAIAFINKNFFKSNFFILSSSNKISVFLFFIISSLFTKHYIIHIFFTLINIQHFYIC